MLPLLLLPFLIELVQILQGLMSEQDQRNTFLDFLINWPNYLIILEDNSMSIFLRVSLLQRALNIDFFMFSFLFSGFLLEV